MVPVSVLVVFDYFPLHEGFSVSFYGSTINYFHEIQKSFEDDYKLLYQRIVLFQTISMTSLTMKIKSSL